MPILFEWFFGIEDYSLKYPIFDIVLNDSRTDIIYSLLIMIISIVLFHLGDGEKVNYNLREDFFKYKIKKEYIFIAIFLMLLPIVVAAISPSREKYFFYYARSEVHTSEFKS